MSKKEQTDREIEELLKELKGSTESVPFDAPPKKEKKQKPMTDDDVKALLRKYYSDVDTSDPPKTNDESAEYSVDISGFEAEKPKPAKRAPKPKKPAPQAEKPEPIEEKPQFVEEEPAVIEEEPAVVEEEPVVVEEEPVVATEEPVVATKELEIIEEKNEESAEQKAAELLAEDADGEADLDEILYDVPVDIDDSSSSFVFDDELYEDESEIPDESEPFVEGEPEVIEENPDPEDEPLNTEIEPEDTPEELEPIVEDQPEETKILAEEEPEKEWVPTVDRSGRLDDGELDLMVALGFGDTLRNKYGDERVRRAEEKMRLREDKKDEAISSFGYRGREYTKLSDVNKINKDFGKDRIKLIIKLIGTALFTVLIFLFHHIELFGIDATGIFDIKEQPVLHIAISLCLLLIVAAFSYKQIINGLLFAFGRSKNGNPIMAVTLAVIVVYDILIMIIAPNGGVMLYEFPVALGFLFEAFTDIMEFKRQKDVFGCLSNQSAGTLYGLCDYRVDDKRKYSASAHSISFAEGYFRHMSRERTRLLIFAVIFPLAAAGALLSVTAAVFSLPLAKSLSAFPAVFAFAAPMTYFFGRAWQKLALASSLKLKKTGIIGDPSDDQINVDYVTFDDENAFPSSTVKIRNIRLFENFDMYHTLYNVNAVFSAVGGPLRDIMRYTAKDLGKVRSVKIRSAAEHYVEAEVDGANQVCVGSYFALNQKGYRFAPDPLDAKDSEDASVMYAVLNGSVCARFCIEYKVLPSFLKTAKKLAADGVGVRIRSLDPNIDRGLVFAEFGENIDAGIIREAKIDTLENAEAVTAVFVRGDVKKIAEPLIGARRMKQMERTMGVAQLVQMCVGIIMFSALLFSGTPGVLMSVAAAAIQLVCVIPAVIIYFLGMNRSND